MMKLLKFVVFFCFFLLQHSEAQIGYVQKGLASFYHNKFHGRRTSSGERFNQGKFTGAHRKLLFNTMVRVTNLNNDKSVVVRINDRGPYKYENRIIDLTWAAAQKIGLLKKGLVPVKIEVIGEDGQINHKVIPTWIPGSFEKGKYYNFRGIDRTPRGYGIQVAAFQELLNARYYANVIYREGFGEVVIKVEEVAPDKLLYKVIVGDFPTINKCMNFIPKLKKRDFIGFPIKY